MLRFLHSHMDSVSLEDVTQGLRACFKVLSKIQMPVAYMDIEARSQTEEMEIQTPEEEGKKSQVRNFTVCAVVVVVSLNTFCIFTVAHHKNDTLCRISRRRERKMVALIRFLVVIETRS